MCNIGAHTSIKPQPGGYSSLFVYVDEATTELQRKLGVTSWNHVIVIDKVEGGWKVRLSASKTIECDTTEAIRKFVEQWVSNPKGEEQ